jgi:hypothetical protein
MKCRFITLIQIRFKNKLLRDYADENTVIFFLHSCTVQFFLNLNDATTSKISVNNIFLPANR